MYISVIDNNASGKTANFLTSFFLPRFCVAKVLSFTLDSGIDVPPGINVAPPLKNFHIRILMHFYINQGIAVIFQFWLFSSKIFELIQQQQQQQHIDCMDLAIKNITFPSATTNLQYNCGMLLVEYKR